MKNTTLNAKYEALKNFLIENGDATAEELTEDIKAVYNENWETFEIIGNEYKVLTDEEADETAKEYIEESLWAFNADFILEHSNIDYKGYDYERILEAFRKMQETLCESANAIVKAMISDMEQFVYDAIKADGRGHFISSYDGEEYESDNFYIYRTN